MVCHLHTHKHCIGNEAFSRSVWFVFKIKEKNYYFFCFFFLHIHPLTRIVSKQNTTDHTERILNHFKTKYILYTYTRLHSKSNSKHWNWILHRSVVHSVSLFPSHIFVYTDNIVWSRFVVTRLLIRVFTRSIVRSLQIAYPPTDDVPVNEIKTTVRSN